MARRDPTSDLVTLEDAAKLDPDEFPAEVVDGRLMPVSRGTWRHGAITLNAGVLLKNYAKANGGWVVAVGDLGRSFGITQRSCVALTSV